jgi:hypothetical protein
MLEEKEEKPLLFNCATVCGDRSNTLRFLKNWFSEEIAFPFLRPFLGRFNLALLRLLQQSCTHFDRFRRRLAWSALY